MKRGTRTRIGGMVERLNLLRRRTHATPLGRWRRVRKRLHDLLWPTEEEAREYRRILRMLEREDWQRRGEADAGSTPPRPAPPHASCGCERCRAYWQGFATRL